MSIHASLASFRASLELRRLVDGESPRFASVERADVMGTGSAIAHLLGLHIACYWAQEGR